MLINRKPFLLLVALVAVVGSLVAAASAMAARSQSVQYKKGEVIEIEIAEDVSKVVFDEAPVYEDGWPAHGNPFITMGYIYPKGTLNGSNGVVYDENGNPSPEFEDKVLGIWVCYGRAINEAGHTVSGPWAVSTQLFQFNDVYDNATIVTMGFESMEIGPSQVRAIVGGSGSFLDAQGETIQTLLGMDEETGAVNISLAIELEK